MISKDGDGEDPLLLLIKRRDFLDRPALPGLLKLDTGFFLHFFLTPN